MSASFTNQVLAQIELWTKGEQYKNEVYEDPAQAQAAVTKRSRACTAGQDRRGMLTELAIRVGSAGRLYRRVRTDALMALAQVFKPEHYRY
jgi:adenosylhomocysteinase